MGPAAHRPRPGSANSATVQPVRRLIIEATIKPLIARGLGEYSFTIGISHERMPAR